MNNDIKLLEIMEKTILTLRSNKDTVVNIIEELQLDYKKKKAELTDIKAKLPQAMLEAKNLHKLDKQLRQNLVTASSDFSPSGHEKLKLLFEKASATHLQMLKAEETEYYYIKRRDALELELKKSKLNIEKAETMAHQLIASLSYLQTGINEINTRLDQSPSISSHYLSFFRCIEDEKSRIARDLHDGPMQRIASVQMRIDFCKTAIEMDLVKGLGLLEHLKQDLTLTLSEVREILFDLSPAPLEKMGLKSCIEHMLYNIFDKHQMEIHFSYKLETVSIATSMQNTLYRIIQELLNNIRKHAQAGRIKLDLFAVNSFIYISLEDNGIGFLVPEDFELLRTKSKSYGLSNIHARIHKLNGRFKVTSHKNIGSTFRIELPLLPL